MSHPIACYACADLRRAVFFNQAHARRFLNGNWKFLVQTGVTILGILHR